MDEAQMSFLLLWKRVSQENKKMPQFVLGGIQAVESRIQAYLSAQQKGL